MNVPRAKYYLAIATSISGLAAGSQPPCEAVELTSDWHTAPLAELIPEGGAVCAVSLDGAEFWVNEGFEDANYQAVDGAQRAGWNRVKDDWDGVQDTPVPSRASEFHRTHQTPLEIKLRSGRGAHEPVGGSYVEIVHQVAKHPPLEGDGTLFHLKSGQMVILADGRYSPIGGVTVRPDHTGSQTAGGFLLEYASSNVWWYERSGDIRQVQMPGFPAEGRRRTHDNSTRPWISYVPEDGSAATMFGPLGTSGFEMTEGPALTDEVGRFAALDVVESPNQQYVFIVTSAAVHTAVDGTWRRLALPEGSYSHQLLALDDGSLLIASQTTVWRATFASNDAPALKELQKAKFATFHSVADSGEVVVWALDKLGRIQGDTVTAITPFLAKGDRHAVGRDGTLASAVSRTGMFTVRSPDGSVYRHKSVFGAYVPSTESFEVDASGRVWAATSKGVVAIEGDSIRYLAQGDEPALQGRVSRIHFLGKGEPLPLAVAVVR